MEKAEIILARMFDASSPLASAVYRALRANGWMPIDANQIAAKVHKGVAAEAAALVELLGQRGSATQADEPLKPAP